MNVSRVARKIGCRQEQCIKPGSKAQNGNIQQDKPWIDLSLLITITFDAFGECVFLYSLLPASFLYTMLVS
ncbi:hypothetical protein EPA93_39375 [Ktedonosporobacter rubrisoli]|uniref:Uncharacterized protein n=1 Tax=Ktedonosporobacter rubrisoli TaxID=2509675 RepID=A0A4V0Z022_KTERU|nr:hypothetical protein [Ktedonosporobacter rubrisoli]QBD81711.1 hypothetical protein EPA93_39375 [Ktedonosporobacter rubrisoli]